MGLHSYQKRFNTIVRYGVRTSFTFIYFNLGFRRKLISTIQDRIMVYLEKIEPNIFLKLLIPEPDFSKKIES